MSPYLYLIMTFISRSSIGDIIASYRRTEVSLVTKVMKVILAVSK